MKQLIKCFLIVISISFVFILNQVNANLVTENKDVSSAGQNLESLLDDVTDLNELSDDLKQAYLQKQQHQTSDISDSKSDSLVDTTTTTTTTSNNQDQTLEKITPNENIIHINYSTQSIQPVTVSSETTSIDNQQQQQQVENQETSTLTSTETTSVNNPSELNEPQTSTFDTAAVEETTIENLDQNSKLDNAIATTIETATIESNRQETNTESNREEIETTISSKVEDNLIESTTTSTSVDDSVTSENIETKTDSPRTEIETTTTSIETSESKKENVETTKISIETKVEFSTQETTTELISNFDQNPVLFEPSVTTKEIENPNSDLNNVEKEEVTTVKSFLSSRRFRNSLKTHSSDEEEEIKKRSYHEHKHDEDTSTSVSITEPPPVVESSTDYYYSSTYDNLNTSDTTNVDEKNDNNINNQTTIDEMEHVMTSTHKKDDESMYDHHHHQHNHHHAHETIENLNQGQKQTIVEVQLNPNESVNNNMLNTASVTTASLMSETLISDSEPQVKYCADFKPIKNLLNEQIRPVISLLPEGVQLILLDETHIGGLNKGVCGILVSFICILLTCWYAYLRRQQKEQHKQTVLLNEKMLIIENNLKKMTFEKQTFESEYNDLEVKYAEIQTRVSEREDKLEQANESLAQLTQTNSLNQKELEKLRTTENRLTKDLNVVKIELAKLKECQQNESNDYQIKLNSIINDYEMRLNDLNSKLAQSENELDSSKANSIDLSSQINSLNENQVGLNEQLEAKEKLIQMLQNSLLQFSKKDIEINTELTDEPLVVVNNSATQPQTFDGLIKIAELQMDIKNLEDQLANERVQLQQKSVEISKFEEKFNENQVLVDKLEQRLKEVEKTNKDQEMQIRLLNELREKDTKQHLKALGDLEHQLKKKSNDADKVSHFLDQLRVKQERIQELESQFARVERQANQERQQFEKQTHENWLQARKMEKEIKESKIEITTLKDKCSELEIVNKNISESYNLLKQSLPAKTGVPPYMSPGYMYQQQQLSSQSQISRKSTESPLKETSNEQVDSNDSKVDQPLQLETLIENRQASSSSPSTSSTSGVIQQQQQQPTIPPIYPPYMMRGPTGVPPYRYPFPMPSPAAYMHQSQLNDSTNTNDGTSASSTPNRSMVPPTGMFPPTGYPPIPPPYRMNPMLFQQQQQYLQQQFQQYQQSKSASSSQQPSPGANTSLPYSHTYPSYLNDSTNLNKDIQHNIEEAEANETTSKEDSSQIDRQSTTSNSNLNQSNFNV